MKQACLNALNCLVTVRLHQIEYLENGNLRDNLNDSLVFDKHNITAIRRSILKLHDDKLLLKQRKRYCYQRRSKAWLPASRNEYATEHNVPQRTATRRNATQDVA